MNQPQQTMTINPETSSPQNELGSSIDHIRVVKKPSTSRPTPREIQSALDVLTALQLSSMPERIHVEDGDIVFFYDFKMVAKGREVYSIRGTRELKEVLTESGIANAPESVELAMLELLRPLKYRASKWINEFLETFTAR